MAAACSSLTVASGLRWRARRSKRGCICCQSSARSFTYRGVAWVVPWVDAPHFDLRYHVQVAQLPIPGDEAQLLQTIEQLRRLDRSRPLWAWFLPGLPDDRIGMFVRLHHVVADGIAGVAALGALLDVGSDVAPALPQPWTPAPRPDARDLLADNLQRQVNQLGRWMAVVGRPMATVRRIKAAWPAMRELFAENPARGPVSTALSVPTERSRSSAATSRSWRMSRMPMPPR